MRAKIRLRLLLLLLPYSCLLLSSYVSNCVAFTVVRADGRSHETAFLSTAAHSPAPERSVRFVTTPESLQHLRQFEKSDGKRNVVWDKEKYLSLLGALVGAIVFGWIGEEFFGPGVAFFTSSVGGGAGFKICFGDAVRDREVPQHCAGDKRFVVDVPSRLEGVFAQFESEGIAVESKSSFDPKVVALGDDLLKKTHEQKYLDEVKRLCVECSDQDKTRRLIPSYSRTLIDEHSFSAAMASIYSLIQAVDTVNADRNTIPFSICRPPSHHATIRRGMGGCLFNTAAVGAFYALTVGFSSVAVVDFDAHFGNGIADCVSGESKIHYFSIHEETKVSGATPTPFDPRTSSKQDEGPLRNIHNFNVHSKSGTDGYFKAFDEVLNAIERYGPSIIILAAGFDALDIDATSRLNLQRADYGKMGELLACRFGNLPMVTILEGGYTPALGDCIRAFSLGLGNL